MMVTNVVTIRDVREKKLLLHLTGTNAKPLMIFHHLTGLLRKHGRISKGALERSLSTNLREINPRVSTDNIYQPTFTRLLVFLSDTRMVPWFWRDRRRHP